MKTNKNDWVEISQEEKDGIVKLSKNLHSNHPKVFRLKSDKNDRGGRFVKMSKDDIIRAASESVMWLKRNYGWDMGGNTE